jgi:hypothetical protein
MVRRWRLIGYFPILYNPAPELPNCVATPTLAVSQLLLLYGEAEALAAITWTLCSLLSAL